MTSEDLVKMKAMRPALLLMAMCALVGCNRSDETQTTNPVARTQTMAPAVAPSSPNGSDAMTQTVDVEDSRSEAEAGSSNSTQTAGTTTTRATAANPARPPAAKKKKSK